MENPKQEIEALIKNIKDGKVPSHKTWETIMSLKDDYVEQLGEQSWHSYIGNKFQGVIFAVLKGYVKRLKVEERSFEGLEILTESAAKRDEVISRKLVVKYDQDFYPFPDVDLVLVWFDFEDRWKSEVLAIVSCKTSLRERVAQSCYWKLKLLSSDVTKSVRVLLATRDNDNDFPIRQGRGRYNGMHRNRVISEYELDGVYIWREDFKAEWESDKVKRFERLFDDIVQITNNRAQS